MGNGNYAVFTLVDDRVNVPQALAQPHLNANHETTGRIDDSANVHYAHLNANHETTGRIDDRMNVHYALLI